MYPDKPHERLSNTKSVTRREQEARTLHQQQALDEMSEVSTDRADDVDDAQVRRDSSSAPASGPAPTREASHAFLDARMTLLEEHVRHWALIVYALYCTTAECIIFHDDSG
jgi:hypothetical protein